MSRIHKTRLQIKKNADLLCREAAQQLPPNSVVFLSLFKEEGSSLFITYDPPNYSNRLISVMLYNRGKCAGVCFHLQEADFKSKMQSLNEVAKRLRGGELGRG